MELDPTLEQKKLEPTTTSPNHLPQKRLKDAITIRNRNLEGPLVFPTKKPAPIPEDALRSAKLIYKIKVEWLWAEQMKQFNLSSDCLRDLYMRKMPSLHWMEYISLSAVRKMNCMGMIGGLDQIHNSLLQRFHIFAFEHHSITRVKAFLDDNLQLSHEIHHSDNMKWEWTPEKQQRIPILPIRFATLNETTIYFVHNKNKNRVIDFTSGLDLFKEAPCHRIVIWFPSVISWHFFEHPVHPAESTKVYSIQPVMRLTKMVFDDPTYESHFFIEILVHYGLLVGIDFYYHTDLPTPILAPLSFASDQVDSTTELLIPNKEIVDCLDFFLPEDNTTDETLSITP